MEKENSQKEKTERETLICPLGRFFLDMEKSWMGKSKFFGHLAQSRIEFLKAIRTLVDERIEQLEKKASRADSKMTNIEVE